MFMKMRLLCKHPQHNSQSKVDVVIKHWIGTCVSRRNARYRVDVKYATDISTGFIYTKKDVNQKTKIFSL